LRTKAPVVTAQGLGRTKPGVLGLPMFAELDDGELDRGGWAVRALHGVA
jgi:hypothetical protein